VTTTSITAVRLSTRSTQSTVIVPEWIQVITGTTTASAWPPMYWKKIGQLRNAPMNSAPVVIVLAAVLPIHRPPSPATIAAMSGRKTMSRIGCISRASG
jgi:hypothetical protein